MRVKGLPEKPLKYSPHGKALLMTIGVGFLCNDGVVLGADTEESYQETKTAVNKIEVVSRPFFHSGIVASGTSYIIEYLVSEIRRVLEANWNKERDNQDIEDQLRVLMPRLYQSKAMKAFPADSSADKYCDILVACRPQGKRAALFQINSTLVTRIPAYALVGCGPLRDIAHEFSGLSLTVDKAAWAALYVVYLAKERWTGIGGTSHILKIWNDGKMDMERIWDQARREKYFGSYRFLSHIMLLETADLKSTDAKFRERAKTFTSYLRAFRNEIRDIEFEYQKYKHKTEHQVNLTKAMFNEMLEKNTTPDLKRSVARKLKGRQ